MKLSVVATATAALAVTNGASAQSQCTASTVYYPVTTTYTTSIYVSPTACITDSAVSVASASPTTTYTTTKSALNTVTVTVTSTAAASSTSTLPFLFTGDSTTTAWLNDNTPTKGASFLTATTTIYVPPAALSPASAPSAVPLSSTYTYIKSTVQTTRTETATVTAPLSTSTSYSVVSDSTSTMYTTRTTTVTAQMSTVTRSTIGAGSQGWNATSSATYLGTGTGMVTVDAASGLPTTATVTYYWASSGGQTYSTSTTVLTTTLYGTVPQDTTVTRNATTTTVTLSSRPANTTVVDMTASSTLVDAESGSRSSSGFPTMSPGSSGIMPSADPTGGFKDTASVTSSVPSSNSTSDVSIGAARISNTPGIANTTTAAPASSLPLTSVSASSTLSGYINPSSGSLTYSNASIGIASPPATTASVTYSPAELTSIVESIFGTTSTNMGNSNSTASLSTASASVLSSYGYATPSADTVVSSVNTMTPLSSAIPATLPSTPSLPSSSTLTSSTISLMTISTSSTTSASAAPAPSVCGEHGNFTLTFDDLPTFSGNDSTDITQAPPIWNPYHHLTFSDGFVYAPLPKEPYNPHSGTKLAVFLGNGTGKTLTPSAMSPGSTGGEPGEISDGAYESNPAFWFDAYTAWVGCDNVGPSACTLNVTGYVWDANINDEIGAYKTQYSIPACPQSENCQLTPIALPPSFRSLTGLQFQAFVGQQQRMFFLDDLALAWSNNTCSAGLTRQSGGRTSGPAKKARVVRRWLSN